jgi:acyl-CoA hydrolase
VTLTGAVTADEAVAPLNSGMRVFVHGAAATPIPLLEAMVRNTSLRDITLYHLHTTGPAPFVDPPHRDRFRSVSLVVLDAQNRARCRASPVSPPDVHGYCTLGTSVDAALAAAISAKVIVAEINEQMPRTLGNTLVPFSRMAAFAHTNRPLFAHTPRPPTLQMGIGAIPDAALRRLGHEHELGVHTEMFSEASSTWSKAASSPTGARACTPVAW